MDPIGPQKKIKSDEYRVNFQKVLDNGGSKKDYDGISFPKSTRAADEGKLEDRWQGKVKGKIKHTYGVDGRNDND